MTEQQSLQQQIDAWNETCPVGTRVTAREQEGPRTTRTEAMALFGRKAVIYLDGHNGYFDLDEVRPVTEAPAAGPADGEPARRPVRTGLCCMFPGQGSQHKGMGEGLFEAFPDQTRAADEILGYSIAALCLDDPDGLLDRTQYTQPALYTVNALTYLQHREAGDPEPEYVLGHSLGEYSALFAAGLFDFETGLKLVKRRGALMAEAEGGGMAAVIGLTPEAVARVIEAAGLDGIDVANLNAPSQTVVSGLRQEVLDAREAFEAAGAKMYLPLKVSGAFHSRYMTEFRERFADYLEGFELAAPRIPVISNAEARPYELERARELLCAQLTSPVRWTESIAYLLERGVDDFQEYGPGNVMAGLVRKIRKELGED